MWPPPFRLKVDLSAPEQFQVDAAELYKPGCDILIILNTLGYSAFVSPGHGVQACLPIVVGREVQAFVPLSIGTSAVRLAAFDGSGDQGSPHDICRIWHCIKEFLTAGFESVSGHGSVRVIVLISIIHDKIIPQGERKIYPVARENGRFLQQAGKFKECPQGICIEITFKEKILSGINGPGLWDREYIILGTERVAALSVYFPDFQDWKTLPVKGMVGMEDRYGS